MLRLRIRHTQLEGRRTGKLLKLSRSRHTFNMKEEGNILHNLNKLRVGIAQREKV